MLFDLKCVETLAIFEDEPQVNYSVYVNPQTAPNASHRIQAGLNENVNTLLPAMRARARQISWSSCHVGLSIPENARELAHTRINTSHSPLQSNFSPDHLNHQVNLFLWYWGWCCSIRGIREHCSKVFHQYRNNIQVFHLCFPTSQLLSGAFSEFHWLVFKFSST